MFKFFSSVIKLAQSNKENIAEGLSTEAQSVYNEVKSTAKWYMYGGLAIVALVVILLVVSVGVIGTVAFGG